MTCLDSRDGAPGIAGKIWMGGRLRIAVEDDDQSKALYWMCSRLDGTIIAALLLPQEMVQTTSPLELSSKAGQSGVRPYALGGGYTAFPTSNKSAARLEASSVGFTGIGQLGRELLTLAEITGYNTSLEEQEKHT
ncbi:hypothetical protein Bbelb_294300 [Branchiostoma belcheri]|nr:hypothetical protein Bbelb_294300 [Branchiostoma belcheri]